MNALARLVAAGMLLAGAALTAPPPAPATAVPPPPQEAPKVVQTASGLEYQDLVVGTGPAAVAGKLVEVHYTGRLTDGTLFDSSRDAGRPFAFRLGEGDVIKGWDEGVAGMRVGGKRKLIVPPQLGYAESGAGEAIPPNATLVFEIELLDVR